MTFEELKSEAEEWVNKNKPVQDDWEDSDIIQAIINTSEPREKRIAELEAKIKHITKHLEPQVMTALFEQVEEEVKQEQRIKELEEENTELKKQQFSLRNERNTFLAQNEQYEKDLIDFNENLSKAKAIITKLVEGIRIISDPKICLTDVDTFVSEAEQFLKDVSE